MTLHTVNSQRGVSFLPGGPLPKKKPRLLAVERVAEAEEAERRAKEQGALDAVRLADERERQARIEAERAKPRTKLSPADKLRHQTEVCYEQHTPLQLRGHR